MRKFVKKIAAVATTAALVAAMGITAFASDFSLMGDPKIFGSTDSGDTSLGWQPGTKNQILKDAGDGIYYGTFTCSEDGDFQYKVLKDGPTVGWNFQMPLGTKTAGWGDNMSQFQASFKKGEYTAVVNPEQGLIVMVQDGKALDFTVRYHSWDEDPAEFVEPKSSVIAAIVSGKTEENYEPEDFDANLEAFKTKAVEVAKKFSTSAAAETTAAPAAAAATTEAKPVKTGDAAPVAVMVTLLAAVAVVAVVAKKKEA